MEGLFLHPRLVPRQRQTAKEPFKTCLSCREARKLPLLRQGLPAAVVRARALSVWDARGTETRLGRPHDRGIISWERTLTQ